MKFSKILLNGLCLLLFAFFFMGLGIYFAYLTKNTNEFVYTPSITLNVGTGDRSLNEMPILDTIKLSFPQFENNSSNYNTANFDCSKINNIIIKVTAINPIDPDGNISRLKFYYYDTNKPENIEFKETWFFTPFTYFVAPVGGEYKFGVILYDNNGGIVDSKDIIGQPSIYLPTPCE